MSFLRLGIHQRKVETRLRLPLEEGDHFSYLRPRIARR